MTARSSSDLKLLLEKFYLHYNPSKVESILFILESFEGKEIELLVSLKQKYGLLSYDPFDNYIYSLVQVQQREHTEFTVKCSFVVPPIYKDLPSTQSQESVSYLLELIRISQLSRESLLSIYNSRLREVNAAAIDRINSTRELCLFEREDMYSHFMHSVEQWMSSNIISFELYEVEIKRLLEEEVRMKALLSKRDLEVEYLQSQLKIAAQVIATHSRTIESASDWDESCV